MDLISSAKQKTAVAIHVPACVAPVQIITVVHVEHGCKFPTPSAILHPEMVLGKCII